MKLTFIRITPDTTRHKEIMLPPNNSLAPNLLHLIFPAIVVLPGMLMAAQSQSPVNWSADGELLVTIENNRRILRMQDNVRISQDSINISGSSAIFEYTLDTQELLRVTVYGTPVIYSQASEGSAEPVTGKSDTLILYDDELTEDTVVEMIGNAFIKSPSSTMNCASIIYVTERDLVREALGPCQGALTSQNGM